MNIVDSSGWLEFFADGPNAEQFGLPLSEPEILIVPAICVFEVFKVVLRERGKDAALMAASLMKQDKIIELTFELSIEAANRSHELKLPMADSIILTTALEYEATLWTQDSDFENFENVKYILKSKF